MIQCNRYFIPNYFTSMNYNVQWLLSRFPVNRPNIWQSQIWSNVKIPKESPFGTSFEHATIGFGVMPSTLRPHCIQKLSNITYLIFTIFDKEVQTDSSTGKITFFQFQGILCYVHRCVLKNGLRVHNNEY